MECRKIIQQRNKKIHDIVTGVDPVKIEPIIPATPVFLERIHYRNTCSSVAATKFEEEAAPNTINLMDTIEVQE